MIPKSKKRRRRLTRILLFPVLAPMFIIGFLLVSIGKKSAKAEQSMKHLPIEINNPSYDFKMVMIPEEEEQKITAN